MAELGENATYLEIKQSYRRNMSYEEDGSVAKARAFITAINGLLAMPSRSKTGGPAGTEEEFDHATLRQQLIDARAYVAENDQVGVTDVDFTEFDRRT